MATHHTQLFTKLAAHHERAFIPFLVLGDPDFDTCLQIVDVLAKKGADALMLSIPFSDPIADGPSIQNATTRAFHAGISSERCFEMLERIHTQHPDLPLSLFLYSNLVFCQDIDTFYTRCSQVGVEAILIADVPLHEYSPFYNAAQTHHITPIFMCPPNANEHVIQGIAQYGGGYTYIMAGIDNSTKHNAQEIALNTLIYKLEAAGAPPAIQYLDASADQCICASMDQTSNIQGVITGTAIATLIEQHLTQPEMMFKQIKNFATNIKSACCPQR